MLEQGEKTQVGSDVVRFHDVNGVRKISTNAMTEEMFLREVEGQLRARVQSVGELEAGWLLPVCEIVCKLRGYKANVGEHRVLVAGGEWVPEDVVDAIAKHAPLRPIVASLK
jgi:hypothetical protein